VTTITANNDPFLTRTEAAALMRLNPRTLDNLAAKKKGPPYMRTSMLCGRALYRRSAVIAYLEACGRQTDPPYVDKGSPAKRGPRRRAECAATATRQAKQRATAKRSTAAKAKTFGETT
jgi:hypothetical protein